MQLHPLGIVTLLELAEGEQIIACGVDQMIGYAITATEVAPPDDPSPARPTGATVTPTVGPDGRPACTSEFSSQTDD